MAPGNRHLHYKEVLNALEDRSPGTKAAFVHGFADRGHDRFAPDDDDTVVLGRCAECGAVLENLSEPLGKCRKCGFDLHACKQCEHFDPSSRFECNQPVPQRISPKDKRNDCTFYSIRVRLEKETSSKAAQRPSDARQAFENLFKK